MARFGLLVVALCLTISLFPDTTTAVLKVNFYKNSCPNVEKIVKAAVAKKFKQTFVTAPATLRLFFHDCFVNGCDASVLISSTPKNKAERDHPDNVSLAGDGFDTVIQAKKALDAVKGCKNVVSCADILTIATRDVVALVGGPKYAVELGRFDGKVSTAASVNGNLPGPKDNVSQMNALFKKNKLTQEDMIALSGAHTIGFAHCSKIANRIRKFSKQFNVDPSLNKMYAKQLQAACPVNVDPRIAINIDPNSPRTFDNTYYKNLQEGKGTFTSDQVLFTDGRTKPTVNAWAKNATLFNNAFVKAMTKLGRVGVKTKLTGNIRRDCSMFN